jgi:hypothetical protein
MLTILLDQNAIEEALTNYIGETTLGVDLSQKEVSIKLTAGRKPHGQGLRAEVSITSRISDADDELEDDVELEDSAANEPLLADEPAIGPFD